MNTIHRITPDTIQESDKALVAQLAQNIQDHRNRDEKFGHFLVEKKTETSKDIYNALMGALEANENHSMHIVLDQTQQALGYILLKNYIQEDIDGKPEESLEVSFRMLQKGLCSKTLVDVLGWLRGPDGTGRHISHLIGRHAIDNTGSGKVFTKSGFRHTSTEPDDVLLPNHPVYSQMPTTSHTHTLHQDDQASQKS